MENKDKTLSKNAVNSLNYDYINNQVTGEKIKIELNKDIKVDKIEFQDVSSSLPFAISKKPSDNKKELIKSLNLGNNKAFQVENINTNEVVNIKDKTIEKSLSNVRIDDEHYKDFCVILYNVKNLFETSQKILGHKDVKRNNGIEINRYANIAKVNNNEYLLEFVLKDNGEVLLYSVDLLNKKKQYRENASSKNSMQHDTVNNSVAHIQDVFKSKLVQKYNNDYKNAVSQEDKTIKLFQIGYHGGAKDFDKFDLSYVLSGEGAMAHGYGVYTAKNKEVSEGYRKTLAQSLKNAKYDGVPLSKTKLTKLHSAISEKLYLKGKDEALKELELLRKQSEKNKDKEGFLGRSSREFLEEYDEQFKLLNSVDESKITGVNKGQLFEVDIPEDDVLLDEDLPLSVQSDEVINSIKKLYSDLFDINDFSNSNIEKELDNLSPKDEKYKLLSDFRYDDTVAKDFYKHLSRFLGSKKNASEKLNEYGIKGIKYDGYQDGECVVVFDDKAVEIIQKFYQEQYGDDSNIADTEKGIMNAKGFFYEKTLFDGTLKDNIMVLIDQKADVSTLVHEFGHIYLQALNRLAKTSPRAKEQLLTVNKWLRFDGNEYTTAQHEKFANGFIAYVKSGKAPSYGLKRVFENFRRWLSDIYNNFITSETVELDEETQKVFDELLGDLSVNQQAKLSEDLIQKAKDNASLRMRNEEVEKGKTQYKLSAINVQVETLSRKDELTKEEPPN